MPRNDRKSTEAGAFQRVASAVKRLFGRGRSAELGADEPAMKTAAGSPQRTRQEGPKARPTKREADIPLDVLDRSYTPRETSSKSGFRDDGSAHQRDQEFAFGTSDERWNDEDHYTNKSGDPRIGTRRRTYEPGENRIESRNE